MESVIDFQNLTLSFGKGMAKRTVLADASLSIKKGQVLALVGASGIGKSTLLRVIAGLIKPEKGSLAINASQSPETAPVSFVFQDARLLPWRRVLANVLFGLERLEITRSEQVTRAHDALALVGLAGYEDRFPHQLSGGQRQRVSLARALALRPDILLMDEPFSALDPITRETMQDELLILRGQTDATIVFVTHDIDEAVYIADRVVALGGMPGRIVSDLDIDRTRVESRSSPYLTQEVRKIRFDLASGSAEM